MTPFTSKKSSILSSLLLPAESYTDASPKGSIDVPIRSLVDSINAIPSLVTTSSCAGRVAVYAAGSASKGSSSGGRWVFVSHSPLEHVGSLGAMLKMAGNEVDASSVIINAGDDGEGPGKGREFDEMARMVHLKFEPLILHILCADLSSARKVLQAAMGAGFRESGIASLPKPSPPPASERTEKRIDGESGGGNGGETERKYPKRERKKQSDEAVMVAIRTTGLAFDAPIGLVGEDEKIQMLVGGEYIAGMVKVANARFEVNEVRKGRLLEGILRAFDVRTGNGGEMEEDRGDDVEEENTGSHGHE